MIPAKTFTWVAVAMAAMLMALGCETKIEDEGSITLAELQGQNVPPPTTPADKPAPAPSTPPLTGGEGIGPRGQGGGFLWKPVSDSTGTLVILLPPQYTGKTRGVYVASSSRAPVETGRFSTVGNGGREHFRFTKKGGAYGSGVYAVAVLKAGGAVHWPIPNGSARTQY